MIDLIHLERLRQKRLRHEAAQRLPTQAVARADGPPRAQPAGRRTFLRVVSAVLVGWAIDGTVPRSRVTRARR